jgi:hypothetical protein
MFPRFRRSYLIVGPLALIVALPACTPRNDPAPPRPVAVPRPDLCKVLDRKIVSTALLGKVRGCEPDNGTDYYAVQFTGDDVVKHHKTAASLTVAYSARYEAKTGLDRWAAYAEPHGSRVSMIGIGDAAVFDAKAAPAPQLMVVQKGLIVTVALQTTQIAVPQDLLPDHLLDVARIALDALPR